MLPYSQLKDLKLTRSMLGDAEVEARKQGQEHLFYVVQHVGWKTPPAASESRLQKQQQWPVKPHALQVVAEGLRGHSAFRELWLSSNRFGDRGLQVQLFRAIVVYCPSRCGC